ncbi:unnamed protein product [Cuscuta europaea]|uniref:Uncharacterized protein n=1 Tax=Cuscuta europaea TaxID=41803 RepID=A0A9P0YUF4_CUSEU|nr:unnamed protein product [Cuscuta europaea]
MSLIAALGAVSAPPPLWKLMVRPVLIVLFVQNHLSFAAAPPVKASRLPARDAPRTPSSAMTVIHRPSPLQASMLRNERCGFSKSSFGSLIFSPGSAQVPMRISASVPGLLPYDWNNERAESKSRGAAFYRPSNISRRRSCADISIGIDELLSDWSGACCDLCSAYLPLLPRYRRLQMVSRAVFLL